jgi:hypothetical protein
VRSLALLAAVATFATACALLASACLPAERIGVSHTWAG